MLENNFLKFFTIEGIFFLLKSELIFYNLMKISGFISQYLDDCSNLMNKNISKCFVHSKWLWQQFSH